MHSKVKRERSPGSPTPPPATSTTTSRDRKRKSPPTPLDLPDSHKKLKPTPNKTTTKGVGEYYGSGEKKTGTNTADEDKVLMGFMYPVAPRMVGGIQWEEVAKVLEGRDIKVSRVREGRLCR